MYSMLIVTALSSSVGAGGIGQGSAYTPNGCYPCYGCFGASCSRGIGHYGHGPSRPTVISYGCLSSCYGGYYGCAGSVKSYGAHGPRVINYAWGSPSPYGVIPLQKKDKEPPKEETLDRGDQRAQLIVQVPAGAELYVDNRRTRSLGASRSFGIPELQKGQSYYYDLRAVVLQNGQSVTRTKRIVVRAGDRITTSFTDWDVRPTTSIAAR